MPCFWHMLDFVESYSQKSKFINPERKVLFHVWTPSPVDAATLTFDGTAVWTESDDVAVGGRSVDITIWSVSVDVAVCGISDVTGVSLMILLFVPNLKMVFGKAGDDAVGGKSVRCFRYLAWTVREPLTGIAARPDTKMLIRSLCSIPSSLLGLFKGWSKDGRSLMWNRWCDVVWYWNGKLGFNLFANSRHIFCHCSCTSLTLNASPTTSRNMLNEHSTSVWLALRCSCDSWLFCCSQQTCSSISM